jgi:alanyl-tRNA synthetase
VTGPEAERLVEERSDVLGALAQRFRVPPAEVSARIDALEAQLAEAQRRLEEQRREASSGAADRLVAQAEEVAGVRLVGASVEAQSSDDLRAMADRLRRQLGSAVVVLGAAPEGRPALLVAATDDVVARGLRADEMVKEGAAVIGGRGGGRPNLAQAGGRDASKLAEAVEVATRRARELLST